MTKHTFTDLIILPEGQKLFEESVMQTFQDLTEDNQNRIRALVEALMIKRPLKGMGFQSWLFLVARMGIYQNEWEKGEKCK